MDTTVDSFRTADGRYVIALIKHNPYPGLKEWSIRQTIAGNTVGSGRRIERDTEEQAREKFEEVRRRFG